MKKSELEKQSEEYADARLQPYDTMLLKAEAKALIAEAYEQGWFDRDTRDMKPETEDEFFNGE